MHLVAGMVLMACLRMANVALKERCLARADKRELDTSENVHYNSNAYGLYEPDRVADLMHVLTRCSQRSEVCHCNTDTIKN